MSNKPLDDDTISKYLGKASALVSGVKDLSSAIINPIKQVNGDVFNDYYNQIGSTQFTSTGAQDTMQQIRGLAETPINNASYEDVGGMNTGQIIGNTLSSTASGAMTGLTVGGPWGALAGGIVGLGSGLAGGLTNKFKANEELEKLNNQKAEALYQRNLNLIGANDIAENLNDRFIKNNLFMAKGGPLETNGMTLGTDLFNFINNGSTHENNPNGGVPLGIAPDGQPNLVEENEVIIKVKDNNNNQSDYVLSNRVYPTIDEIFNANITKNAKKYADKSWAEIYKDIIKSNKTDEIINRADTKKYLESLHQRISQAQETTKLREQQEEIMKRLKKASPEEQNMILQQMEYNNPLEESMYAFGGKIYIKPENRGKFTESAKRVGMGVQEFARHVLANKEDYSSTQVKRANFARNFGGHKKEEGGPNDLFTLFSTRASMDYKDIINYNRTKEYPFFYIRKHEPKKNNNTSITNSTTSTLSPTKSVINKLIPGFELQYQPIDGFHTNFESSIRSTKYGLDLAEDNLKNKSTTNSTNPNTINADTVKDINTNRNKSTTNSTNPNIINTDTVEDINTNRNKFNTNSTNPNTINTDTVEDIDTNRNKFKISSDMILPITSGLNVLSDAFGVTNYADYSNVDRISNSILPPRYIGYTPTGKYITPKLVDNNYLTARMINQGNSMMNNIKDLSGSNRATAISNMMAQNYANQQILGEILANSREANNKAINAAITANNAVDRANAENALRVTSANQGAWENYIRNYADAKYKEATFRENIDQQVGTNKSVNWNNFLENLQGYFDNQRNREIANSTYQGTGYWIDKNYKVHYNSDNPSNKTKKNAEKKATKLKQNNNNNKEE